MVYVMVIILCLEFSMPVTFGGTTRFVETPPHEIHVKIPSSPFNLTWTFNFSGVAPKLTVTSNKNIQLLQYTNTHGRKGIVVLTVNHQKDLIESLGEVLIAVILIQSSGRMFVERSVVTLYISKVVMTSSSAFSSRISKTVVLPESSVFPSIENYDAKTKSKVSASSIFPLTPITSKTAAPRRSSVFWGIANDETKVKTKDNLVKMRLLIALVFIAVLFFTAVVVICVSLPLRRVNQNVRELQEFNRNRTEMTQVDD